MGLLFPQQPKYLHSHGLGEPPQHGWVVGLINEVAHALASGCCWGCIITSAGAHVVECPDAGRGGWFGNRSVERVEDVGNGDHLICRAFLTYLSNTTSGVAAVRLSKRWARLE